MVGRDDRVADVFHQPGLIADHVIGLLLLGGIAGDLRVSLQVVLAVIYRGYHDIRPES